MVPGWRWELNRHGPETCKLSGVFRVLIQLEQTSSTGLSALGSSLVMENSCSDTAHLGLNPNRLISLFFLEIESPAMQHSLRPRLQAPGCFSATSWYLLYHQRGGVRGWGEGRSDHDWQCPSLLLAPLPSVLLFMSPHGHLLHSRLGSDT